MGERRWRVGETRFLGLAGRRAWVAGAVTVVMVVGLPATLFALFGWTWVEALLAALILGFGFAFLWTPMWSNLGWLAVPDPDETRRGGRR